MNNRYYKNILLSFLVTLGAPSYVVAEKFDKKYREFFMLIGTLSGCIVNDLEKDIRESRYHFDELTNFLERNKDRDLVALGERRKAIIERQITIKGGKLALNRLPLPPEVADAVSSFFPKSEEEELPFRNFD